MNVLVGEINVYEKTLGKSCDRDDLIIFLLGDKDCSCESELLHLNDRGMFGVHFFTVSPGAQ